MGIVAQANVPNLVLQFNVLDRGINYKGLVKTVPDNFWNDEIKPKLYPLWDTDKDRLVEFTWYDIGTYHCIRRKHIKNFKTGLYEWIDYEMEQHEVPAAEEFYEFLKDTFLRMEQILNAEFQEEMGREYGEIRSESWLTIRLARNFLLQETDYIFCTDVSIPEDTKQLYTEYRQKLRELPAQFGNSELSNVRFPISPEAYSAIYRQNFPDRKYLETEDQWITLGSFFYTTFKEKMIKYLSVRDITDKLYIQAFILKLKDQPVGLNGTPWAAEQTNALSVSKELDGLLVRLDNLEKGAVK